MVVAGAVVLLGQSPALAQDRAETENGDDVLVISSVRVTDGVVEVVGSGAGAGAEVAVHGGSPAAEPGDVVDATAEGTGTADGSGGFTVSIPRSDGAGDRLYSQFVAEAGGAVSGGHFADDFAFTPRYDYPYQPPASKKGLSGTQMADDVEELGATSSKFNLPFQKLVDAGPAADPGTQITFESQGRTFYFNRSYVERMDRQVKTLYEAGAPPYFILLLQNKARENSALDVLMHPNADPSQGGRIFAFNTVTDEGIAHYTAAVEFLTDRYSRTDARYGRAAGWVVGNEIDAQWVWGNAGEMTMDEYLDHYMTTLRLTYLAARKATTEPVVMTSLTKHWNHSHDTNPLRSYKPRDILDSLARRSKNTGDFPWHVAYHSYPQDLRDPRFWNDPDATHDVDTKYVTFKNLEVLVDYMRRPEMLYQGEPRRIALTEQGAHTLSTEDGEELQAAAYALAYYRILFLDGIDAFVNQRHVTHGNSALRHGLWTNDPDRPEPNAPGRKKKIYNVFKYIDTERSLEVTEFAKDIIGITNWSEMVPGFDPDKLAVRDLPTTVGTDIDAVTLGTGPALSDFSTDTDNWEAGVNTSSVSHITDNGGALRVHFNNNADLKFWSTIAKTWKGTNVDLPQPINATNTPHLTIPIRVPDPGNLGTRHAKIKVHSTNGTTAEGTATLHSTDWTTLTLDLSTWTGNTTINNIKVWVRGTTNNDWSG
ncbi:DUF5722 domain-containing protein, partial [Haloactinopolyspora alba]|uniref:DUF5722 domain-containing protein n=1 Tax=Haloactinopolyspora alba TaxID=648780 RepID=UPI001F103C03